MSEKPEPTGGIDVNSDITPITKQPIEQVKSSDWNDMSVADLYEQLRIMQNRYFYALGMGKGSMADQIQRGINHIQALIVVKQNDDHRRGKYEVK